MNIKRIWTSCKDLKFIYYYLLDIIIEFGSTVISVGFVEPTEELDTKFGSTL